MKKCRDCKKEFEPTYLNGIATTARCPVCFRKAERIKRKKYLEREKIRNAKKREKQKEMRERKVERKRLSKEAKKERRENDPIYLKKVCWKLCSEYTRRKNAMPNGFVQCVTCPRVRHWKSMQAGHFIPGRRNSYLFDDRGLFAQCYGCNCGRAGSWVEYEEFMINTFGEGVVNELKRLRDVVKKFTPAELKGMIEDYKIKIKKLN